MAATQHQLCPAPFDAVAERYDESFTFSHIGRIQRNAVWRELSHTFRSGDRILEVGCGTGVDACYLAERDVRVVACDSSSQMVTLADRRVQERGLQKLVHPIHLRAEEIPALQTSELFDGAFSNFGALNCVNDLGNFASDLAQLVKPGAKALLCWIGPCCLWEVAWYLGHGQPDKAFRRFRRGGVEVSLRQGPTFRVYYPSVRALGTAFNKQFTLRRVRGIGVSVPPSYVEVWAAKHSRLLRICETADLLLGRFPGIRAFADHVLLEFERRDTTLRSA
jgi:SAM-dependent methyltransferase